MLSSGNVSRIKTISGWTPFGGPGEQLLLKVTTGPRKSAGGVQALVNYVARASEEGDLSHLDLFDEAGEIVPFADLSGRVRRWGLLADSDNLTPKARNMVEDGAPVRHLPERERFWRIQAYHFVWSQTTDGTGLTEHDLKARMLEAAREFVFTEFADKNRQVLWGMHEDHPGRPHIHFIVKARTSGTVQKQLRFGPEILEDMRARLASVARQLNIPVHSQRREDRKDLLDDILSGFEPLRNNIRRVAYDKPTELHLQVPLWFAEEGQGWLERKTRSEALYARAIGNDKEARAKWIHDQRPPEPRLGPVDDLPEDYRKIYLKFSRVFYSPREAMNSFLKMTSGSGQHGNHRSLAIWYLSRQPLAFGDLVQNAEKHLPGLTQAVRKLDNLPVVNWRSASPEIHHLAEQHQSLAQTKRRGRERHLVLMGLNRLRRNARREKVQGPTLELVRKRVDYVRNFEAPRVQEVKPALHRRVVDFVTRKRKKTR
jgi:hypothetical protein